MKNSFFVLPKSDVILSKVKIYVSIIGILIIGKVLAFSGFVYKDIDYIRYILLLATIVLAFLNLYKKLIIKIYSYFLDFISLLLGVWVIHLAWLNNFEIHIFFLFLCILATNFPNFHSKATIVISATLWLSILIIFLYFIPKDGTQINASILLIITVIVFSIYIATTFHRISIDKQIDKLTHFDELSNMYNRNTAIEYLKTLINQNKKCFGIMILDIDDLKIINDTFSHIIGDMVIRSYAEKINKASGNNFVARFGSDEFIVIFDKFNNKEAIIKFTKENFNNLSTDIADSYKVHISSGLSFYPNHGDTIEEIMACADIALIACKNKTIKDTVLYTNVMKDYFKYHNDTGIELKSALDNDELFMIYQPKFKVQSEEICGFEALVRWRRPNGEIWTPYKFITIAEQSDLIFDLDYKVLNLVFKQISIWLYKGYKTYPISINISGKQFKNMHLLSQIVKAINKYNIPTNLIQLEITETAMLNNINIFKNTIEKIKKLGITVQLDDFGTGYSALNYLNILPIDCVKLDKSFINEIGDCKKTEAIIEAIISLGKSLGKEIVAEGVEKQYQKDFIANTQCDIIQGYYYSKPKDVPEIEALYLTK